ncbi:MAG: YncE family protein [Rhodospirillales bacterium]|nr:YncE family protein [Rhodospirillales bacterium]
MKYVNILIAATFLLVFAPFSASAHILAMVNYESKTEEGLAAHGITGHGDRKEGIAVIDVDPESKTFGDILVDISLPSNLVGHHMFYNRDMSKLYVTALGQGWIYVMDMETLDYKLKKVPVPGCVIGEDIVFSEDNKTWYMTCMGSGNIIVGDVETDAIKSTIFLPMPYPHGIAINDSIDRILVTNTIKGDLTDPGETITAIEVSTQSPLASYKLSDKPSPSGVSPVEVLFVPGSNPPMAYVNAMFGGAIWSATWNAQSKEFDIAQAYDFNGTGSGVPLEIYFGPKSERMYVTTANPGDFHIFDISNNPAKPELLKTIKTAAGAHHVGFTKDWKYGFVQNAFINLKGMDDGSISVVDLESETVVASFDTLKNRGFNPNCIVLLPKWNDLAGH